MFFQGSLQEGITTALQQSKQVVCFVTDDGVESQQWEDEFLTDAAVKPGLEVQSVVLRLQAGSQEAGYLEALFPVPKKPTVVVIHNGQMTEYIAAGTGKDEFIRRLAKTFQSNFGQTRPSSDPITSAPTPASEAVHEAPEAPSDGAPHADVQPTATPATVASSSARSQGGQATTTETHKSADVKGKGKAKAEPEEEAPVCVDGVCYLPSKKPQPRPESEPEQKHASENKRRKQHADEERKRILQRIENDKRARREREAEERRARELLSGSTNDTGAASSSPTASIPLPRRLPQAGQANQCSLQVRLLDGSTIRNRFPSDKTLAQDVRKWIDEDRTDGDAPYSFRVVLTPLPNKVIQPQEELQSLLSLGLTPSATLVLIPVRHSVAYARGGGVLTPVIGMFSTLYGAIMASLGGIFKFIFGGGNHPRPPTSQNDIPMQNLRARRDAQLYNGNSLNFEPRHDDDDGQQ
ncbi:hypothetical protein F5Y17DRAFT_443689 [Xylariaceae sp. FL0594]|nr:hypothetical protein F5Y17DRAFT_443689 [Xylariaceae sp. FL0594]